MDWLYYLLLYLFWVWECGVCVGLVCAGWIALQQRREFLLQRSRHQPRRLFLPRNGSRLPAAPQPRHPIPWQNQPPLLRLYNPALRERRLIQLQQRRRELQQLLGRDLLANPHR